MRLCVITPVKDSVAGPAHLALVDAAIELTKRGVDMVHKITWLSSNLAEARAHLVQMALASGSDRVLFIDDDIVFSVADLDALLAQDVGDDIISGAYRKRVIDGPHIGDPLDGGECRGALLEMRCVGLGFALATRTCLERLIGAHGSGLFEFRHDGTRHIGEDERFSERWRELGGRLWLHTQVNLGHVGPHIFR